MVKSSTMACLSLFALLVACKKDAIEDNVGVSAVGVEHRPVSTLPASPQGFAGLAADEMKDLLTEDKLSRFAVYQTEMLSSTADTTGLSPAFYQKAGTDTKMFQGANDEIPAKIAAARQAALAKSGLNYDEVSKLIRVVIPYYARIYAPRDAQTMCAEARKRIEEARSAGKESRPVDGATDKACLEQANRLETQRKEFATRYGEDALTIVKKHERDFLAINQKMMAVARGGLLHNQ
jgi:hypothetical protein